MSTREMFSFKSPPTTSQNEGLGLEKFMCNIPRRSAERN